MSTVSTINEIDAVALQYTPLALQTIAGIEAAASGLPGQTKKDIATNIILAGAHSAEGVPIPTVQAIGGMIDLFVSLFKVFSQAKAAAAVPPAAPVAPVAVPVASATLPATA